MQQINSFSHPYQRPHTVFVRLQQPVCLDFGVGSGGADPELGLAPQRRIDQEDQW